MNRRCIGILGHADDVTTARYFERAAVTAGHEVIGLQDLDDPSRLRGLDCLLVIDPSLKRPEVLKSAPCPVVVYLIDVHQQLPQRLAYARYCDHVFVAQPDYSDSFRHLPHPSVHWLPLACDPDVHFLAGQERVHDVGFVGKFGHPGSDRHTTLTEVLSQFSTNETGRFYTPREMGGVYSSSKIVFNKSINRDLNMRFYEAMAAGALLVTDRIGNGLADIGEEGTHFVAYDTPGEAADKIRYYLANDEAREGIARCGQALMFQRHTYAHRLGAILDVVAQSSMPFLAPARSASPVVEGTWRSEYMRLLGAPPADVMLLLGQGNFSRQLVVNAAIAAARGVVRPVRQRIKAWTSAKR